MAQDKKCVLLYTDLIHTVEHLDDADAGLLFKHYLRYINDRNPEPPNKLIAIVFEPIKQALKRDLKKWEAINSDRSTSGAVGNLKRWHPDIYDRLTKGEIELKEALEIAKSRKPSQTVTNVAVIVKDKVKVKDKVIVKDKEINIFNAFAFMSDLGFDDKMTKEWFDVRKLKKLKNSETALSDFNAEVLKTGKDKNEILRLCVIKSWGGFKASWLEKPEYKDKPILNLINQMYGISNNE